MTTLVSIPSAEAGSGVHSLSHTETSLSSLAVLTSIRSTARPGRVDKVQGRGVELVGGGLMVVGHHSGPQVEWGMAGGSSIKKENGRKVHFQNLPPLGSIEAETVLDAALGWWGAIGIGSTPTNRQQDQRGSQHASKVFLAAAAASCPDYSPWG